MRGNHDEQRARRNRALFCFWALLAGACPMAALAETPCAADHIDEQVRVAYAYDGDTVRLEDGRRLRLIGIDTPELGRDGAPDQPYAVAARDALRDLLDGRATLKLRFDATRHDVHGRLLAHAFLTDGTSVSAWLLQHGYATLLIIPPDTWNVACYQEAETAARAAHSGIWSLAAYRPVPAADLPATASGYHLIGGRVTHIGRSAHSLWIDLEGNVAARIASDDLDYFAAVPLTQLEHRTVTVRGWVYPYKGQLQLRLRYPTDLEIMEP